jgi:dCMP deaminase
MTITSQDHRMILKCKEISAESHDPHRKVGVVITNGTGKIIAIGTNAPPKSLNYSKGKTHQTIAEDPQSKYFLLEHAERNAIFSALVARNALKGSTLFGTLYPCADCARAIIAVGITRIVVPFTSVDPERDIKWADHHKYARLIFERAGVQVEYYEI